MPEELKDGDNFEVKGRWRVLAGKGWHDWRLAGLEASLAAALHNGDEIGAARFRREIAELRQMPVITPLIGTGGDAAAPSDAAPAGGMLETPRPA